MKTYEKPGEVLCTEDFVEDGTVYWGKGCYYELVGMDGENYLIRNEFNAVGCIYADDFDDYFKLTSPGEGEVEGAIL